MARIRTIKPEFFTSLTIADLPLTARLTFIGLWTHVDDDGRCVDEPRLVRAAIWPLDDRTAADVEDDLRALHDASLIVRYEHAGRRYLAIRSWSEHQRIDKAKPSKLPAPEEGAPVPPTPPTGSNDEPLSSGNSELRDSSEARPGLVPDGSATRPGRVPVGTGNREGNREGNYPPSPHGPQAPDEPAARETGKGVPDRMTDAFLERFGPGNTYGRRQVRRTIADALDNDIDPTELWAGLERLGGMSKPVTLNTLQFAFAEIRRPQPSVSGGDVVPLHRPGAARPSTADQRAGAAYALAAELAAEENP